MALVMLPCDLPWWPQLQRHLTQLTLAHSSREFVEGMQRIHNMCNIGLDPEDDDSPDNTVLVGLEKFLENDMAGEERRHFLEKIIPAMVDRALKMKQLKPAAGFHFSLQQQADRLEIDRAFIASLLAHAFFSTFPKRSIKTHPTLQDFNFSNFFRHLDSNCQKAKLRSILHYFDLLDNGELEGTVLFSRQVMNSKEWLTIEDWLECALPLSQLSIRHEGRLDRAGTAVMAVCFSSSRLGGKVLDSGSSQECVQFCTQPELLVVLPFVEALEDNEVLMAENLLQVARIVDPHNRATFEPIQKPSLVSVCCMDPENYMRLPLSQFEEDNVLRELNKVLLAFRQQHQQLVPPVPATRRLSPIGESFSSTPTEHEANKEDVHTQLKVSPPPAPQRDLLRPPSPGRRGRFIVLGSSGECLPVNRTTLVGRGPPFLAHSESGSGSDEFHSAKSSLDNDEEDEGHARRYSAQLDTPERRSTFAARLRDALRRETNDSSTSSTDSSYAVGISVAGSGLADGDIKLRRGGSRGFMLQEDSLDEQFLKDSLQQEREWINNFRSKRPGALTRKDTGESSKYSFSTDCSSELEELYDQYSRWLEDAEFPDSFRELDARDIAVVRFAGSLLKRTLSDSFAGISLTDLHGDLDKNKTKIALAARSLSLELARHKHKIAAQLVSMRSVAGSGVRPVATGNWGCGSTHVGEPQLKLVLQWLAASVAGVPTLHYFTCGHHKLLKLDTVCRVLLDRRWTVGELAGAALRFAQVTLADPQSQTGTTLFDELIGAEKSAIN